MKLTNYIWEIYSIAKKHSVQRDVAMDMFIANLNQKTNKYHGANVDYEKLGAEWEKMKIMEQHNAKLNFNKFTKEHLMELSKPWRANDREAFNAVVEKYTKEKGKDEE